MVFVALFCFAAVPVARAEEKSEDMGVVIGIDLGEWQMDCGAVMWT
jgi:hypothetical protein